MGDITKETADAYNNKWVKRDMNNLKGQIKQLQTQNKLLKQGIIDDAEIATVLVPRESGEQLQTENEKLKEEIIKLKTQMRPSEIEQDMIDAMDEGKALQDSK